jgi:hypothetical protein
MRRSSSTAEDKRALTRLRLSSLVAVAVAVLLSSVPARAQKTPLAVVPFTGPQAQRAEAVVVRALRKKAQLIPAPAWKKSAAKLFANTHSPEDIAAVAEDVGAKVVITGVIKRDGRAWQLSVSVRDGADGKSRERLKYPLKAPRIPVPILAMLAREIGEAFDSVAAGGGTPEETTPTAPPPGKTPPRPPKATPPPVATTTPTPAPPPPPVATVTPPPATPSAPPSKEEELAPVTTARPEDKPPPPPPTTKRPRWAPWFDANAGLSISGRQFDFDTTQPPHFTSGVVAGIFGDVTIYPLAFTWNKAGGVFSGLGLGAGISRPFWPDSTSRTDTSQHFPTSELMVEGGLRWRVVLYKAIPRPELLLQAGGGLHTFALGKDATGQDVGPPDVAYKYVNFGAGFRLHFAEWAMLRATFDYHLVLAAGAITDITTEYGGASIYGLRFTGGLDFIVYKGLKLGLEGYYERFNLKFVPGSTMPAHQAGAAVDQYFGGVITVGYVL